MPEKNKKQDDNHKNKKSQDKPEDKVQEKSERSKDNKAKSARNADDKPPSHTEDLLDESLEESFPASDPPSITRAPEDKRETRQPPPKDPAEPARHKR